MEKKINNEMEAGITKRFMRIRGFRASGFSGLRLLGFKGF